MNKLANWIIAAAAAIMLATSPSLAEGWAPNGSLKLQIGFGAGGTTDTIGRVLAKVMEEQTGWNVIVENKGGGGGVAMFTGIANMPPRGQVIGMGVNMPIMMNLVRRGDQLGFDLDSFDYLGTVAYTPVAVVAKKDAPFNNLAELIAYSKNSGPAPVAFGAGPQKMAFDKVTKDTGVEFNMVSTKGGSEIMKLILGGQVLAGFSGGEHFPYMENGEMKVIATTAPNRLDYAPDAPTFNETGHEVYADPYYYIATTKGTDPAAIKAITAALENAIASDEVTKIVQNTVNFPPTNLGPEGTKAMMQTGVDTLTRLIGN